MLNKKLALTVKTLYPGERMQQSISNRFLRLVAYTLDTSQVSDALAYLKAALLFNQSTLIIHGISLHAYALLAQIYMGHQISVAVSNQSEADELQDRELIYKTRLESDRRQRAYTISEKGVTLVEFMDELLVVSCIDASSKLDEQTFEAFERALQVPVEDEPMSGWLVFPASFLGELSEFLRKMQIACNRFGLSILQLGILLYLNKTEVIDFQKIGSYFNIRPGQTMFMIEDLARNGLIHTQKSFDRARLSEKGMTRLNSILGVVSSGAVPLSKADDDILQHMAYIFSTSAVVLTTSKDREVSQGRAYELENLKQAVALAGRLMSYPSIHEAELRISEAGIAELNETISRVTSDGSQIDVSLTTKENPESIRQEYTRLFFGVPPMIPLTGESWVTHKNEFALSHGERASVALEFRRRGLKNKPGKNLPADNLVSELDFLWYIISQEQGSLSQGDVLNAREWEKIRHTFYDEHFREFAYGVAEAILHTSVNYYLEVLGRLLNSIAQSTL